MGRISLFQKIKSYDGLLSAWAKVRANQGAAGSDGRSIASFERNLDRNLRNLGQTLQRGSYRPGPLRRVQIPKPSGGKRKLSIPTVTDRVIQTSVAQALVPILDPEMEDSSFAYRPGRSTAMAVKRVADLYHQGYTWVVDGDIDDYFDNIPHSKLITIIKTYIDDVKVVGLISLWLSSYHPEGKGIAQGSPLSPLLSNIYLDDIDEAICGRGVRLVRFADDFVLLCKKETGATKALSRISELLGDHGLVLDPGKTRIASFSQGFSFLGRLFVRSLVLKQEPEPKEEKPEIPGRMSVSDLEPNPDPAPEPVPAGAEPEEKDQGRRSHLSPRVRILFVIGRGRRLDVRNKAFSVLESNEPEAPELLAVPPDRVDRIELWPGTTISDRAQRHALAECKQVAYVHGRGETLGTLEPPPPDKARLHLAQAECILDPGRRLDLARRIVDGKIRNQRALLHRLNRRRKNKTTANCLLKINRIIQIFPPSKSVEELMGFEGQAAKLYWRGLKGQIAKDWSFTSRNRRPPRDPINSVISYSAMMLYRDILCLIQRHGLHPGFGALHGSLDGHQGCASDLTEEFRAPLSEGFAVYLANTKILKSSMFVITPDHGCLADREGRRLIIRHFQSWLNRPVKSPQSKERIRWRGIIEEQVLAYRETVLENEPYRPYIMDY